MVYSENDNRQIRINFYSNIFTLVVSIVIGLCYTPYLIHELGLLAYAVVPLAIIINQYIGVVTNALTSALTRFYSVFYQKGDYLNASKNLSTSLIATLIIIITLMPFMALFIANIEHIFTIPQKYIHASKLLFMFTISGFFISLISSLLNVTMFARNRLDYMNLIKTIRCGGVLLFTLLYFNCLDIRIEYVGLSNLTTEILILIISVIFFCKFKNANISIKWNCFDKSVLYAVLGMTGWTILHQMGDVLIYRIDTIIVNVFWGAADSARIGAIGEFGWYIVSLTAVLGGLFGPIILIEYSNGNYTRVKDLALTQSFLVGTLAAIVAGVLSGISPIFLDIWLGDDFTLYGLWLFIKLFPIPFYAAAGVLSFVFRAWNYVKKPAIITVLLGLLNTALIAGIGFFSHGVDSSYIVYTLLTCAVFDIMQSYVLSSYCVIKLCDVSVKESVRIFSKIVVVFVGSCSVSYFISKVFPIYSFISLIIFIILIGIICLLIVLYLIYSHKHRRMIFDLIK